MQTYLITGGCGSLGKILVEKIIASGNKCRVIDINEAELARQKAKYDAKLYTPIYGDISNRDRVNLAMRGVDVVIHTAAMKNITITEHNPAELIRVNVDGTKIICEEALTHKVKTAIFISSDKAVQPSTIYGTSKLAGEYVWKWASGIQKDTNFVIVRSGNFFESAGNVFELWERQHREGKLLTLTDPDMARYFIEAEDVADICLSLISEPWNLSGRVVIPRMQKYNMMAAMINKYGENVEFVVTGKRKGEKMSEKLMYDDEKVIFESSKVVVVE